MAGVQVVFWLLVTLAILIPIHEYGHYRVAKACGVKVLGFSVGFGPVLLRRIVGPDRTEFALRAIPLGGYVRMLDEREGNVAPAELHRAFGRRPLYQRALVVAAGPAANLALAVALYAFVSWWGQDMATPIVGTPAAGSAMAQAGLQRGDRIVATAQGADADDDQFRVVRSFDDVGRALSGAMLERQPLQLRVTRENGLTRTLTAPVDRIDPFVAPPAGVDPVGLSPIARLGTVVPDGAAAAAGLREGDLVLAVDGKPITDAMALRQVIEASGKGGKARPMAWEIDRTGQSLTLNVTAHMEAAEPAPVARVGVGFLHEVVRASPLDAIALGAQRTWREATGSLRTFGLMLTGKVSSKAIGGPGTIGVAAASAAKIGFIAFLSFLALVSLGLGVLNLLPVPILDGGMLLYYLFEGVTGRPVSDLWQSWLQRGGVVVLLLLMTLALSNDAVHLLGLQ